MNNAALRYSTDAARRGIDQCYIGQVEGWQVLIVKGWALAAIGVVGFQCRGCCRVLHDFIYARANLFHDAKVGVELFLDHLVRRQRLCMLFAFLEVGHLACQIVIVRLHCRPARRNFCEAGASGSRPTGFLSPGLSFFFGGFPLIADINRGRRALKHVQLFRNLGEFGYGLHRSGASADDTHGLVFQIDMIVPARGMKRVTRKRLHTFNARELWRGKNAVCQHHKSGAHGVTAIGGDSPTALAFIPLGFLNRGMKQAMVIEVEFCCQCLTILHDFETSRELHGRDVAHLFQ